MVAKYFRPMFFNEHNAANVSIVKAKRLYLSPKRCEKMERGAQLSSEPHWQWEIVEISSRRADLLCMAHHQSVHVMRSTESSLIL